MVAGVSVWPPLSRLGRGQGVDSAELKWDPKTCKDPAGKLRFRAGLGPKAVPNQAPNIWRGTHEPAHNDYDSGPISVCLEDDPKHFKL